MLCNSTTAQNGVVSEEAYAASFVPLGSMRRDSVRRMVCPCLRLLACACLRALALACACLLGLACAGKLALACLCLKKESKHNNTVLKLPKHPTIYNKPQNPERKQWKTPPTNKNTQRRSKRVHFWQNKQKMPQNAPPLVLASLRLLGCAWKKQKTTKTSQTHPKNPTPRKSLLPGHQGQTRAFFPPAKVEKEPPSHPPRSKQSLLPTRQGQ